MGDLVSSIGLAAAALTALSYVPQVRKAWPRHSTDDLSLKMLVALTCGLLLWIVYGISKGDWVIIGSNIVAASLSGSVLLFKVRDIISRR